MWTNCRARLESIFLSIMITLLETFDVFGLDAVQKTNKTEQNVNELLGPPGNRSFWALSTLLESLYVFRLDAVQNTMKTEKTVNELSGSPGKHNLSIINTPRDTWCFWTWFHPKDHEKWKTCERIFALTREP